MKVIEGMDFVYFDVDDTLVLWDHHIINKYPENCKVFKTCEQDPGTLLVPIIDTIQYLKESKKHGCTIIVWSSGGWEWAKHVVEVLELEDYVDAVMTKPHRYVDDLPCKEFMGTWVNKLPQFERRMKDSD